LSLGTLLSTGSKSSLTRYSVKVIAQLVQSNWIRTTLWTISAIIVLILTAQLVTS